MTTETLLLGGRGQIGSGLRTYLPRLDTGYRFTSVDLPGAANRAEDLDDPGTSSISTSAPSRSG